MNEYGLWVKPHVCHVMNSKLKNKIRLHKGNYYMGLDHCIKVHDLFLCRRLHHVFIK